MKLDLKATNILKKTLATNKKLIVHQGSSRSSKTWSIFQFFLLKALSGEEIKITIARDKLTWVKSTLLADFAEMTQLYNIDVSPAINVKRPEQIYMINGSEFGFFGLDEVQKLHGRKQDWFWINEVMEVSKASFDQLEMRTTTGGILDFNPSIDDHWVFDLQRRDDVEWIHSTFKDNPFLEKRIIDKINGYEPTKVNIKAGTADNFMWEVYGLGNKARLIGAVFENWETTKKIPKNAKLLGIGLDFGFSNDPTAVIEVYTYNNNIILNEILYERGLTNDVIAKRLLDLGVTYDQQVICDSSEPKSIEELRRNGINAKPATKGPGSILHGIDLMKQHKLLITTWSTHLENELRKYKWAEDRMGKMLNKPIDDFNHAIDAARYLISKKLGRGVVQVLSRAGLGL